MTEAKEKRKGKDGLAQTVDRVVGRLRGLPRWLRLGAGVALVAGGFVGFLPVLGFWMVPAGLLILAIDVPWLRPVAHKMTEWISRAVAWVRARPAWKAIERRVARRRAKA